VVHRHGHLALALGERLAVLLRHHAGNFVGAAAELVRHREQVVRTDLGRQRTPALEGALRVGQCPADLLAVDGGDARKRLAGRRVDDVDRLPAADPLAVQIVLARVHGWLSPGCEASLNAVAAEICDAPLREGSPAKGHIIDNKRSVFKDRFSPRQ
jgi:hypothetical protein